MQTFLYRGTKSSNFEVVSGSLKAENKAAALAELRRQKIEVRALDTEASKTNPKTSEMARTCLEWLEKEAAKRKPTAKARREKKVPWIQKPEVARARRLALAVAVLILLACGNRTWQGTVAAAKAPAPGITATR